jgi:hypothetical protein
MVKIESESVSLISSPSAGLELARIEKAAGDLQRPAGLKIA